MRYHDRPGETARQETSLLLGARRHSIATATAALPRDAGSASTARRFATAFLNDHEVRPATAGDAILLISELVSNAIEHTDGDQPIHIVLTLADGVLHVAVEDPSPVPPALQPVNQNAYRGRGLQLIEAVAMAWGTRPRPGGKTVWFEIAVA